MEKLKVIVTTDVHGTIYSESFSDGSDQNMGFGRLSSYLKDLRVDSEVLLIDNGDVNQGSPLVTYTNKYEEENIMSKAFNLLEYDYINIGNHDFNYGSEFLMNYIKATHAKCITSNVLYKNEPIGYSKVIEVDSQNLKLGIAGVVTDYIENWEKESNLTDIDILSVFNTVKKEVDSLRDKTDKIIVFYHGGLEKDVQTGQETEVQTGENVGYKILTEIEGIDVLITGHQHRSFSETVNNTVVIQCANNLTEFMELSLADGKFTAEVKIMGDYEVDETFLDNFKDTHNDLQEWLDQSIGEDLDEELIIEDIIKAQKNNHPFVTLVNQAQVAITGADISVSSLYDTTSGFKKTITYRDLVSNFPFPNTLVVKAVTGKVLREFLEKNAEYWVIEDGKIEVNPSFLAPKRQIFNYDMTGGIEYTIKVSNPIGSKIIDLTMDGQAIEDDKEYKLALNNYRATGGGDFAMLRGTKTLYESGDEIIDVMNKYIRENQPIKVNHKDNVKIIV